jgi:ATP-dependent DNA ligase
MEALLVDELPVGDAWQYEPKWDGFRGVLENDGGKLALWSRNGRPLLRYFPELRPLGDRLPPHSALDGEVVVARGGRLDFDALQLRLHPAESRITKLSGEIPAVYVVFDCLLWQGEEVWQLPLAERRARVETLPFDISPMTTDAAVARDWLVTLETAGLDGVVAKRRDLPYLPGSRDGVAKVKHHKTADCVIVGFRWSDKGGGRISTLLLGLYGDDGELDFVGHCSGFSQRARAELEERLPALVEAGFLSDRRIPGGQSRWSRGKELDWNPVRPELVCEVRYDKLQGDRFRHGTRFLRFRPDKDPSACTWDQVRPPRRPGELTVQGLLS